MPISRSAGRILENVGGASRDSEASAALVLPRSSLLDMPARNELLHQLAARGLMDRWAMGKFGHTDSRRRLQLMKHPEP
jgi:hypothetical protein